MSSIARNVPATQLLAEAVTAVPDEFFTTASRVAARRAILDLIGCAVAGSPTTTATQTRAWVGDVYAAGQSTLWFTDQRVTASAALVANSTAGSILDGDDLHWPSWLHAGASIVPAAIAAAEETQATFTELLDAVTIGYEACCRVAQFVDWEITKQIATGHWCGYGVAAAVGRLRGVDTETLGRAFGLVAALTPTILPRGATINQNDVKEGIPWGTLAGLQALDLAQRGLAGPARGLENNVIDIQRAIQAIGIGTPVVRELAFKPYVSCAWTHVGVDALTSLMATHGLKASDIDAVEVLTFSDVVKHLDPIVDPQTLQQAQYSYPFVLGIAACRGVDGLLPLRESSLGDPEIIAFAGGVSISASDEFDRQLPEDRPAQLTLRTAHGDFETTVPRESNPFDDATVKAKFVAMCRGYWSDEHAERTAQAVLTSADSIEELAVCLRQGVT